MPTKPKLANPQGPANRPRWVWASLAVAVVLLGLFVTWALGVRVKTSNGIIELTNLPKDADVYVDDEVVAVTWPGGGKPAVISATAGKHAITVKKDGLAVSGDEVRVQAGETTEFTVRFASLDESRPTTGTDNRALAQMPIRALVSPLMPPATRSPRPENRRQNTTRHLLLCRTIRAEKLMSSPAARTGWLDLQQGTK